MSLQEIMRTCRIKFSSGALVYVCAGHPVHNITLDGQVVACYNVLTSKLELYPQ